MVVARRGGGWGEDEGTQADTYCVKLHGQGGGRNKRAGGTRCVGTVFVQTGLRPFAPPARNSAPALNVIADGQDYVKSWSGEVL